MSQLESTPTTDHPDRAKGTGSSTKLFSDQTVGVLVLMQRFQLQCPSGSAEVTPSQFEWDLGSEVLFWFGLGHVYDHTPLPAPFRQY